MKLQNFLPTLFVFMLFAGMPATASAQDTKFPQRNEIVTLEVNPEDDSIFKIPEVFEVFSVPAEDGGKQYFLSVGHLGMGDEVVQVLFDPIFELFIPLGNSLQEALDGLQQLQNLFKESPGTSLELSGCLAFGVPNEDRESVKVTLKKPFLSRYLEFSVQREGYIRATSVRRSELNSLASGVKFYRTFHPNE